ncbi:MAG: prenyltransferase/squalene oxidase repeat-containing protein [Rubripirellula sp.]
MVLQSRFEELVQRARQTLNGLRTELLNERVKEGYWEGKLSPSSLSTATAVSAISATLIHMSTDPSLDVEAEQSDQFKAAASKGIQALQNQQNTDGGFGDTDRSHSNIATSYLVLAASSLARQAIGESLPSHQTEKLEQYIEKTGAFEALKERYGTDKTFVVPILTNLAIAGIVPWDEVPALPFEAAAFPQSMYRLLRMPVVSYAVPALVAIGQIRHYHGPKAFFPVRWIRSRLINRTMSVLLRMQPQSGGFLEATPLTAFVVMSLAATGRSQCQVSKNGLEFLLDSMDEDGLWPIDTNLATWVTSLSMHALSCDPEDDGTWCTDSLIQWHLSCQHLNRHPFTGAEPGGWGWSDLSGAVPDSDDTPAAILALSEARRWRTQDNDEMKAAIERAVRWLELLQNRNGGWPTFCRGWGKLPFDRSSNDLTAHAMRALLAASAILDRKPDKTSLDRARRFLINHQQSDGSWLPLWFGNQDREDESNPIYGTAKVLAAAVHFLDDSAVDRATNYLICQQNHDGGWGGGPSLTQWLEQSESSASNGERPRVGKISATVSSIEETALALDSLLTVANARQVELTTQTDTVNRFKETRESLAAGKENQQHPRPITEENQQNDVGSTKRSSSPSPESKDPTPQPIPTKGGTIVKVSAETIENKPASRITEESKGLEAQDAVTDALCESIIRGTNFLIDGLESGRHRVAWPIGFYFAKLWYHEKLYPYVFSASALGKFLRLSSKASDTKWPT